MQEEDGDGDGDGSRSLGSYAAVEKAADMYGLCTLYGPPPQPVITLPVINLPAAVVPAVITEGGRCIAQIRDGDVNRSLASCATMEEAARVPAKEYIRLHGGSPGPGIAMQAEDSADDREELDLKPFVSNNASGYRGVYPQYKHPGRFIAWIQISSNQQYVYGLHRYLGSYSTVEEAARVYAMEYIRLRGGPPGRASTFLRSQLLKLTQNAPPPAMPMPGLSANAGVCHLSEEYLEMQQLAGTTRTLAEKHLEQGPPIVALNKEQGEPLGIDRRLLPESISASAASNPVAPEPQPAAPTNEVITCTICHNALGDSNAVARMAIGRRWACAHLFHGTCIQQWSKVANECPLCKVRYDALVSGDGTVSAVKAKTQSQHIDATYWGASDPLLDELLCMACNKDEHEATPARPACHAATAHPYLTCCCLDYRRCSSSATLGAAARSTLTVVITATKFQMETGIAPLVLRSWHHRIILRNPRLVALVRNMQARK